MTPVEPGELEAIAADLQEELMNDTATILKVTKASDGQGGKIDTPVARAEGVPCGYGPLKQRGGGAEDVVAGRPSATARWLFRMPAGTEVKTTDVVVVDGDDRSFRVEILRGPRSWNLLTRFEAVTIDVGGPAGE